MAEILEEEKIKIKINTLNLLLTPVCDIPDMVTQIPREGFFRSLEIFWQIYGKLPEQSRKEVGNLAAIFPAFLIALDGDLSETRMKYLAEFVLAELEDLQKIAKKRLN